MSRRIGKFKIAQHIAEERPSLVHKIMGETIIVRCEMMYESDAFEYTALSDHFDVCESGEIIPEYIVMINSDLDFTFLRSE